MQLVMSKLIVILVLFTPFVTAQSNPIQNAFGSLKESVSNAARQVRDSFTNRTTNTSDKPNMTNVTKMTPTTTPKPVGLERSFYMEKNDTGNVKKSRMIEVISDENAKIKSCKVFGQLGAIENRMKRYPSINPNYVNRTEMQNIRSSCQPYFSDRVKFYEVSAKADSSSNKTENDTSRKDEKDEEGGLFEGIAIYPGTKWCGAGDVAENYDDLGSEAKPDACCREHDQCDDNIKAGESKHGLNNTNSYTSSSCECDEKFHKCLREAKSFIGDQIGRTYFNVLQTQCFKKDYPIVNCTDEKGFLFNSVRTSCQSYQLNTSEAKVYQFFDAKFYEGQAGPLFKIPGVSKVVDPAVQAVKNHTINGGLVGNLVG